MRGVLRAGAVLSVLAPLCVHAANETIQIELNTAEPAEKTCRVNFVVENKAATALDTLRLDIVVFGQDGGIKRRLIAEMGPVRPQKTTVKFYVVEVECSTIGALLLNDVTACAPTAPAACLDTISLSSRVKEIRFYK